MSRADHATDTLSLEQAYRAMYRFVRGYFERGGDQGRELLLFLSYAEPDKWESWEDNPVGAGDPAAWADWLRSVREVCEGAG